jgi:hypothetical protein
MLYGGFIFLPTLSTQSVFDQFDRLYRKTLKYCFALPKKTWNCNLLRHLLVPTAEQNLYISLARVLQSTLSHFGSNLAPDTKAEMLRLVELAQ